MPFASTTAVAIPSRRLTIGAPPASAYVDYTPAAVTDQVNAALDDRDGSYALRLITHAASVVQDDDDKLSDDELRDRPSQIKDPRWEQLFRAVYGDALPPERRSEWVTPSRLSRRWYVSRFAPLREKARPRRPSASVPSTSSSTPTIRVAGGAAIDGGSGLGAFWVIRPSKVTAES